MVAACNDTHRSSAPGALHRITAIAARSTREYTSETRLPPDRIGSAGIWLPGNAVAGGGVDDTVVPCRTDWRVHGVSTLEKSPLTLAAVGNERAGWCRRCCESSYPDSQRKRSPCSGRYKVRDHDRSADCAAELVALQLIALRREEVPRVEHRIADEFKQIAVQLVGPGARDHIDDAARITAVLGRVVRRSER